MSLESISKIADFLGKARETVTKAVKSAGMTPVIRGKAHLYESREVAPLLFDALNPDELDLTAERARLAHHQANKAHIESDVLAGKLVPAEDVERHWSEMVAASRAKLLSLPQRIAQVAVAGRTIREIEASCRQEVYDALNELGRGVPEGNAGVDPATDDDGSGMGGGEKVSKPRSKRGTRKMEKRQGAALDSADGVVKSV